MSAAVDGFTDERFAGVRAQFQANLDSGQDVGASCCMTIDGKTVVDLWGGLADEASGKPWTRDTIVNVLLRHQDDDGADGAAGGGPGRAGFRCAGGEVLAGVRSERKGGHQGLAADESCVRTVRLEGKDQDGRSLRLGEGDIVAGGAGAVLEAGHRARLSRAHAGLSGWRSDPARHGQDRSGRCSAKRSPGRWARIFISGCRLRRMRVLQR